MTQEVQPLTWQKRTNLEEHQQFFSKINEIIANLAPTVNEAEAAITQATQAIASANSAIANANDAVETANAASAAASAAASQAQTAASTVAGYGDRLSATESKNDQQDTAISALQTADGQNVKINSINQYAVGLTGNQRNIAGKKVFLDECTGTAYFGLTNKRASFSISDRSAKNRSWFRLLEDINGITLLRGFYDINENGTNQFSLNMDIDVGGTTKTIEVIGILTDASGVVTRVSVGGRVIT